LGVCILLVASTAVLADIRVFAGDEGRVTVVAQDASNQAILEALGGQLGFEIVIEDAQWASQQRSFERAGEIDTLLEALLSGTSHVLSYSDDRVGKVTVLIPGSSNAGFFIDSKTTGRPNGKATTPNSRQADYFRRASR
jgi:hypothetical protein